MSCQRIYHHEYRRSYSHRGIGNHTYIRFSLSVFPDLVRLPGGLWQENWPRFYRLYSAPPFQRYLDAMRWVVLCSRPGNTFELRRPELSLASKRLQLYESLSYRLILHYSEWHWGHFVAASTMLYYLVRSESYPRHADRSSQSGPSVVNM